MFTSTFPVTLGSNFSNSVANNGKPIQSSAYLKDNFMGKGSMNIIV